MKKIRKGSRIIVEVPLSDYIRLAMKMKEEGIREDPTSEILTESHVRQRRVSKYNLLRDIFRNPSILKES